MSILITVAGELALLFFIRLFKKSNDEKLFHRMVLSILIAYLIGVFMVTLGHRSTESVGETNLLLFSTFKHMFAPTVHRIREWGFLRGIKELKWIGYPSWESVILNYLLLLPLGYLLPLLSKKINSWCRILLVGLGVSLFIETAQLFFYRGWFDVDDLFLNAIGAFTGWGLYKLICSQDTV